MNLQKLQSSQVLTAEEIQTWIVGYLAESLEVEPDEIDVTLPFDNYGLDSAEVIELSGDLEDWLGRKINPTFLYNYPTVESLAQGIALSMTSDS